jgi:hypothetical protein
MSLVIGHVGSVWPKNKVGTRLRGQLVEGRDAPGNGQSERDIV